MIVSLSARRRRWPAVDIPKLYDLGPVPTTECFTNLISRLTRTQDLFVNPTFRGINISVVETHICFTNLLPKNHQFD